MNIFFLVTDKTKETLRAFSIFEKAERFIFDLLNQSENTFKTYYINEAEVDWYEKPILIASFKLVNNQVKKENHDSVS